MVKHGVLKKQIIKTVSQLFPCQERKPDDAIEFSIVMNPFNINLCSFVIEKFKNIDVIRVVCIILTTPKIQQSLKKLSREETEFTMGEFDKIYHKQFNTEYKFSDDYSSIQNTKFFLTQNLSYQSLLDLIFLNIILTKEVAKIFNIMDTGVQSPKIDSNNSMYK